MSSPTQTDKQRSTDVKPKKEGIFSRLVNKAKAKLGIIEKTKLTEDFVHDREYLEDYRRALDPFLDGLEAILQPDPELMKRQGRVECHSGRDPYEVIKNNLAIIARDLSVVAKAEAEFAMGYTGRLALETRKGQKHGRTAIRRLRMFMTRKRNEIRAHSTNVDKAVLLMDQKRHEVKLAKTKDELEDRGIEYQKAIKWFNDEAQAIQDEYDSKDQREIKHQRDVVRFGVERERYHLTCSAILKEMIDKRPTMLREAKASATKPPKKVSRESGATSALSSPITKSPNADVKEKTPPASKERTPTELPTDNNNKPSKERQNSDKPSKEKQTTKEGVSTISRATSTKEALSVESRETKDLKTNDTITGAP